MGICFRPLFTSGGIRILWTNPGAVCLENKDAEEVSVCREDGLREIPRGKMRDAVKKV